MSNNPSSNQNNPDVMTKLFNKGISGGVSSSSQQPQRQQSNIQPPKEADIDIFKKTLEEQVNISKQKKKSKINPLDIIKAKTQEAVVLESEKGRIIKESQELEKEKQRVIQQKKLAEGTIRVISEKPLAENWEGIGLTEQGKINNNFIKLEEDLEKILKKRVNRNSEYDECNENKEQLMSCRNNLENAQNEESDIDNELFEIKYKIQNEPFFDVVKESEIEKLQTAKNNKVPDFTESKDYLLSFLLGSDAQYTSKTLNDLRNESESGIYNVDYERNQIEKKIMDQQHQAILNLTQDKRNLVMNEQKRQENRNEFIKNEVDAQKRKIYIIIAILSIGLTLSYLLNYLLINIGFWIGVIFTFGILVFYLIYYNGIIFGKDIEKQLIIEKPVLKPEELEVPKIMIFPSGKSMQYQEAMTSSKRRSQLDIDIQSGIEKMKEKQKKMQSEINEINTTAIKTKTKITDKQKEKIDKNEALIKSYDIVFEKLKVKNNPEFNVNAFNAIEKNIFKDNYIKNSLDDFILKFD